jgi:hypothetical protein
MKKGLGIVLLIIVGIVAVAGLLIGAVIEIVQAVIGFVVWTVIILVGYFFIKSKTD